ncbi:MAG: four helix bundle protein [Patescibacteria group bacterium]
MFDFENLTVYKTAESFNNAIFNFLKSSPVDNFLKDQLKRASTSIVLNIAEGAGRFSKKDKRNFYIMARGSVFECVAILKILKSNNKIIDNSYSDLYDETESLSKMLMGLIKNLSVPS